MHMLCVLGFTEVPVQKLKMAEVVPGDAVGTTKKYRIQRVLVEVSGRLFPICWTIIATDGSVSFGLAGDITLAQTGEASFDPDGKVCFNSKTSLEDIPELDRRNTHATIHRSGVCHVRAGNFRPVIKHTLEGWFPVKAGFRWILAYTGPVGTLSEVGARRSRDAVMPFPDLESSARIEVSIYPRTSDGSVPLVDTHGYTFAGMSPHHIVRLTIDNHRPVVPTLIMRQKMGELKFRMENA